MMDVSDKKFNKFCLICLDSKRALDFGKAKYCCEEMAKFGYYFDKISRIAYDKQNEIKEAFSDAAENFQNIMVLCPKSMDGLVRNYFSSAFNTQFNQLGILCSGEYLVAVIYSDFDNRVLFTDIRNILVEKYGVSYDKICMRFVGATKNLIEQALNKARSIYTNAYQGGSICFNLDEKFDDFKLEIIYSSQTPKMLIDNVQRCVIELLSENIYALEDVSLAEQIYRLLRLRRLKLATAESFTGGGVAKKLVEVPGVSEVYTEGLNTYSNASKQCRLGVKDLTLKQCGAVSPEVAYQMAEGLVNSGSCNVAVSTTGIAGPASDNTSKPVGLAYIGVALGEDISVYRFNFSGNREEITNKAINHALFLVYKKLK